MKGLWLPAVLGALSLTVLPARLPAQGGGQTLDAKTKAEVVGRLATLMEKEYVFPDIAARYGKRLRENLRAGSYADVDAPSKLADRLTADLQAVHGDLHLKVLTAAGDAGGPVRRVVRMPAGAPNGPDAAPEEERGPAERTPSFSPVEVSALPPMLQRMYDQERRANHYFKAVEVLPGNVGYIDYDQFGMPEFSARAADAAFAFLAEVDAMILDLRDNPGGIEGMNQYIASHFFGDEPVHLYSRFYRSRGGETKFMSVPTAVKRHFPDIPLYVLISGRTGSAAENLSFALQGLHRAVLVGEATAGAAHSSTRFPVEPGFVVQMPVARAFDPRTGKDWEGVGVVPEVKTTADSALATAVQLAIDTLMTTADPADRPRLEDARELARVRFGGAVAVDPTDYVGTYGIRRVWLEGDHLRLQRIDVPNAPPVDLVPLGPDYFTLKQLSVARIRFERENGRVVRLRVRLPTGEWEEAEKDGR